MTEALRWLPDSPELYLQRAAWHLEDGKYEEAAAALSAFVAANPKHELAPNAMYWLGEAHYVRRDYPAALAAFEGLLRDYPGNRKTPDALLKVTRPLTGDYYVIPSADRLAALSD